MDIHGSGSDKFCSDASYGEDVVGRKEVPTFLPIQSSDYYRNRGIQFVTLEHLIEIF
jgi:hypothetical protein